MAPPTRSVGQPPERRRTTYCLPAMGATASAGSTILSEGCPQIIDVADLWPVAGADVFAPDVDQLPSTVRNEHSLRRRAICRRTRIAFGELGDPSTVEAEEDDLCPYRQGVPVGSDVRVRGTREKVVHNVTIACWVVLPDLIGPNPDHHGAVVFRGICDEGCVYRGDIAHDGDVDVMQHGARTRVRGVVEADTVPHQLHT